MSDFLRRAHQWIMSDDTGLSSEQIWSVMMGVACARPYHPCDPSDLGRCLRLLEAVPEWRSRIGEMASQGPEWAVLVKHWGQLEASFLREAGSLRPPVGTRAEETYRMMGSLIVSAQLQATKGAA